jgi:hypothetical protein
LLYNLLAMGRHSKDDGGVHTREERRLMPHGTKRLRLSKDSVRQFDHCCLGLAPPHTPVVTPQGFLFDKQAILENLLAQKQEAKAAQARAAAEERMAKTVSEEGLESVDALTERTFVKRHESVSSVPLESACHISHDALAPISREESGENLERNFWLHTPAAHTSGEEHNRSYIRATRFRTRCPVTNKPLRARVCSVLFHRGYHTSPSEAHLLRSDSCPRIED